MGYYNSEGYPDPTAWEAEKNISKDRGKYPRSMCKRGDEVDVLKYTVELTPITKKNSQQILTNRKTGRPFIMPSKRYKAYEKAASEYLVPKPQTPIDYAVNVQCVFYMPTRRRVDLTNLLESICDVLVHAGVVEDDNCKIIATHDGSRCEYDKHRPRTEIVITRIGPEQLGME